VTSAELLTERGHPGRQHRRSVFLLVFGIVRIIGWTIMAALIGAGLAGIGGFLWAKTLAESIPFVALISVYANWATDVDAATAAFAALVASDSHAAVVTIGDVLGADLKGLKADITKLAGLHPGPEAAALEESIQQKLTEPPEA
jgi:hypothetical protein